MSRTKVVDLYEMKNIVSLNIFYISRILYFGGKIKFLIFSKTFFMDEDVKNGITHMIKKLIFFQDKFYEKLCYSFVILR